MDLESSVGVVEEVVMAVVVVAAAVVLAEWVVVGVDLHPEDQNIEYLFQVALLKINSNIDLLYRGLLDEIIK